MCAAGSCDEDFEQLDCIGRHCASIFGLTNSELFPVACARRFCGNRNDVFIIVVRVKLATLEDRRWFCITLVTEL